MKYTTTLALAFFTSAQLLSQEASPTNDELVFRDIPDKVGLYTKNDTLYYATTKDLLFPKEIYDQYEKLLIDASENAPVYLIQEDRTCAYEAMFTFTVASAFEQTYRNAKNKPKLYVFDPKEHPMLVSSTSNNNGSLRVLYKRQLLDISLHAPHEYDMKKTTDPRELNQKIISFFKKADPDLSPQQNLSLNNE